MRNLASLILCSGFLALSQTATAGPQPCGWPLKVTGSGLTNIAFPDTNATYWVMPVDTTRWQAMIVKGTYTRSRFFSFTAYFDFRQPSPKVVDYIIDSNINPDSGSTNPFQPPESTPAAGTDTGSYTITFDGNASGPGNHVQWANGEITYILYRIYVADKGLSDQAGAPLPALTLVDNSGNEDILSACPVEIGSGSALSDLIAALEDSPLVPQESCAASQPQATQVTFTPNNVGGGRFFPNPVTTYFSARGLCPEAGKIVVVRGQAPDFPDTYTGGSIFQPHLPGSIQLRYWSMCNNKEEVPGPVVACKADYDTPLDAQNFYTYVVSTDSTQPAWIPPGVAWLPWGDPAIQNALLFRDMLPASNFTLSGPYMPTGVFCDKQTFIEQGWQACFATAQP